jgi:chaperonin GroES
MAIRPLGDRLLVKRVQEEQETAGGIIIPDSAKEKPIEGKVIAVGNGKRGDDGKPVKLEVKIEGEEHLILREDDILGIVE